MAKAIVEATTHYNNPEVLAKVSKGLGKAMAGLDITSLPTEQLIQHRGW
jgi:pyridoxal 5'-phosphate synthase pdxS subunit